MIRLFESAAGINVIQQNFVTAISLLLGAVIVYVSVEDVGSGAWIVLLGMIPVSLVLRILFVTALAARSGNTPVLVGILSILLVIGGWMFTPRFLPAIILAVVGYWFVVLVKRILDLLDEFHASRKKQ